VDFILDVPTPGNTVPAQSAAHDHVRNLLPQHRNASRELGHNETRAMVSA